jgi:hypothetical protein
MPISVGIAPPSSTLSVSSVCSLSTTSIKGEMGAQKGGGEGGARDEWKK